MWNGKLLVVIFAIKNWNRITPYLLLLHSGLLRCRFAGIYSFWYLFMFLSFFIYLPWVSLCKAMITSACLATRGPWFFYEDLTICSCQISRVVTPFDATTKLIYHNEISLSTDIFKFFCTWDKAKLLNMSKAEYTPPLRQDLRSSKFKS